MFCQNYNNKKKHKYDMQKLFQDEADPQKENNHFDLKKENNEEPDPIQDSFQIHSLLRGFKPFEY